MTPQTSGTVIQMATAKVCRRCLWVGGAASDKCENPRIPAVLLMPSVPTGYCRASDKLCGRAGKWWEEFKDRYNKERDVR